MVWGVGMALHEETLIDYGLGRIMNANIADAVQMPTDMRRQKSVSNGGFVVKGRGIFYGKRVGFTIYAPSNSCWGIPSRKARSAISASRSTTLLAFQSS